MAHDLFDAMVGFFGGSEVGADPLVVIMRADGKNVRVKRSQVVAYLRFHPGSKIAPLRSVAPAVTPLQRAMQLPQGYGLQQGYPQQPMMQAQPYGPPQQPGYGPQGYSQGYGQPGPVNYGPQGPGGYPYPTDMDAPDGYDNADDVFPEDNMGVAAAVGEAAVGTEQYAQVGGVDITRWLVDPWDAATADAAHRLMVLASGLSGASTFERVAAQRTIAELKKQSNKGNPLAQRAMIKFGSITKMVQRGRPVPSVAVLAMPAPGTVVARRIGPQSETERRMAQRGGQQKAALDRAVLAEKTRAAFNAQKSDYEAQLRDLNTQLERRDWSDETRKQLEAQAADFQGKLDTMAAAQAAQAPGGAVAPAAAEPSDEIDDAPLSEGADFDADVAGADGA